MCRLQFFQDVFSMLFHAFSVCCARRASRVCVLLHTLHARAAYAVHTCCICRMPAPRWQHCVMK